MPCPRMPWLQAVSAPILATPHSGSPAAARIATLGSSGLTSGYVFSARIDVTFESLASVDASVERAAGAPSTTMTLVSQYVVAEVPLTFAATAFEARWA